MSTKKNIKRFKKAQEWNEIIDKYDKLYPNISQSKLAEKIAKESDLTFKSGYIRSVIGAWKKMTPEQRSGKVGKDNNPIPIDKEIPKKGLEIRGDHIVINWENKTIITNLGEFGNYTASFDRHSLIQRMYVDAHGGETASIVAMEFDFPHTKAVYVYAKHHGFTKASVGQTDLEFEIGLTVEDAVNENIQKMKRDVYKKTQKREWKETVDAANKWWNFDNTVLEAIQALDIDGFSGVDLPSIIHKEADFPFAALMGISDVHYLKLCYDHKGGITYNRDIARERLKDHTIKLANETARYGKPDQFFVIVGNDNMHIDGIHHSTTKLTPQHQATDGMWRLELKNYMEMQIDQINFLKNISKVVCIPVKGNHDYETSIALQATLALVFRDDPMVEVIECHDARTYTQYGKICLIATHGDELGSINKLEKEAHKLIMGEAKEQGIDVMEVDYYILVHGHEHVGSTRDLNGHVQRIGLSSLSDIDDWWHKEKGFVGRQPESLVAILKKDQGRKALMFA